MVCTFPNDTATINIERAYADEDFLVESIVQAGQFYTVAILPKLPGKWYTRSDIMPSAVVNDSTSAEYMVQITHNLNGPRVSHACNTRVTCVAHAYHTQALDVITRVVSSLACARVYSVIHACKFKQCGMVFNQWSRTVKSS